MRNLIISISIIFVLAGCQEEVTLNLPFNDPKLVIEGMITDQPGPYQVKLSLTKDYFAKEDNPKVSGAVVTISDNTGISEQLIETSPGVYSTQELQGTQGRSYTLNVLHNGEEYQATGNMTRTPVLDSLKYSYVEETTFKEEGYYLYFFGTTPKDGISYYRWLIYKNDSLYNSPEDMLIANDEFVTGNITNLELPYAFEKTDTVRLEMFTLSRDMYDYYLELQTLLFNDGGLFSPPPINPTTNIINKTDPKNKPLGYFQVSSMVKSPEIIIE